MEQQGQASRLALQTLLLTELLERKHYSRYKETSLPETRMLDQAMWVFSVRMHKQLDGSLRLPQARLSEEQPPSSWESRDELYLEVAMCRLGVCLCDMVIVDMEEKDGDFRPKKDMLQGVACCARLGPLLQLLIDKMLLCNLRLCNPELMEYGYEMMRVLIAKLIRSHRAFKWADYQPLEHLFQNLSQLESPLLLDYKFVSKRVELYSMACAIWVQESNPHIPSLMLIIQRALTSSDDHILTMLNLQGLFLSNPSQKIHRVIFESTHEAIKQLCLFFRDKDCLADPARRLSVATFLDLSHSMLLRYQQVIHECDNSVPVKLLGMLLPSLSAICVAFRACEEADLRIVSRVY